jgi:hypothetical protein
VQSGQCKAPPIAWKRLVGAYSQVPLSQTQTRSREEPRDRVFADEDDVTNRQKSTGELNWFEGAVFVVAVTLFAVIVAVIWLLKAVSGRPKFVVDIRL